MDAERVGRRIAALRKERGLTQDGLAERLGISPQAISKWENGRALPDTALLPGLARALACSIDFLLIDRRLHILRARYGDGIDSLDVTSALDKRAQGDGLEIDVAELAAGAPATGRPAYLTVMYQVEREVYCAFAPEGGRLTIDPAAGGLRRTERAEIVAAVYGAAGSSRDMMHKIDHYRTFDWNEYRADHELFFSDPGSDAPEYLTLVYLNRDGIHLATCAEGESLAFNEERTELTRKRTADERFLSGVPELPEFGKGWECSWAAALTAALNAMGAGTSYERVMGVSGACYRLAFCSPGWDYSSVDGLVAYDYATPGLAAFGYTARFAGRVEKEKRAEERAAIVDELRRGMPVLGINLRVAAEWGVICGYRKGGELLYCRTKYDAPTIRNDPEFMDGHPAFSRELLGRYDTLPVDNWPFILQFFATNTTPPTDRENLLASLRVLVDSAKQAASRGYAASLNAYDVWRADLLDADWYRQSDDEKFARRFSVDQFCTLALHDARAAAHAYLRESQALLPGRADEMRGLAECFGELARHAGDIRALLDSGEALEGARARGFWTGAMREAQAERLGTMRGIEERAVALAERIIHAQTKGG